MNVTIAVALITAVSTLSAGFIAGVISLKIHGKQVEAQHKLSAEERREQNLTNRRQIRRDAYVQFLNQYGLVERELERCWHEELLAEHNSAFTFLRPAKAEMEKLAQALNIVVLEGPNEVALAGQTLQTRLTLELATVAGLFNEPNRRNILIKQSVEAFSKAGLDRARAKQRMIDAAQAALEQDS